MLFLGIDLAWAEGTTLKPSNESGVAAITSDGAVVSAGWRVGVDAVVDWAEEVAQTDSVLFVDAPLIVNNPTGQRLCERQVGQRYGRWDVSANTTNLSSKRLGGVRLRLELERRGWRYDDGRDGPPRNGRLMSECYPYTTIVGVEELGYEEKRPRYKRKPPKMRAAEFRPVRAEACDGLLERMAALATVDPPLRVHTHPESARLVRDPSPTDRGTERLYKHREDLLDALLCAWTASLWVRHGVARCQVLGLPDEPGDAPEASIVAPARPGQRRD